MLIDVWVFPLCPTFTGALDAGDEGPAAESNLELGGIDSRMDVEDIWEADESSGAEDAGDDLKVGLAGGVEAGVDFAAFAIDLTEEGESAPGEDAGAADKTCSADDAGEAAEDARTGVDLGGEVFTIEVTGETGEDSGVTGVAESLETCDVTGGEGGGVGGRDGCDEDGGDGGFTGAFGVLLIGTLACAGAEETALVSAREDTSDDCGVAAAFAPTATDGALGTDFGAVDILEVNK